MKKMIEMLVNEGLEIFVDGKVIMVEFIKWDEFTEVFDIAELLLNKNHYEDAGWMVFNFNGYKVAIEK